MEDWPALGECADVRLYRRNAFRVTGTPTLASARDLRRHTERAALERKLGRAGASAGRLAPRPPPTSDEVAEAERRLLDVERRFLDEVFWLWPTGTDGGPAHDAAIEAHVRAVEDDGAPRAGWDAALAAWSAVLRDDAAWATVETRRAELDDPRIPDDAAARIRTTVPAIVAATAVGRAAELAAAGRHEHAAAVVAAVRGWRDADAAETDRLARAAIAPAREALRAAIAAATKDSEERRASGDEIADELLRTAAAPLAVVDAMLPRGHAFRTEAHDELALGTLGCLVEFANATKDWAGAVPGVERARAVAEGAAATERLDENLRIARTNTELHELQNVCFFCRGKRRGDAVPAKAFKFALHGDVQRTPVAGGTHVTWRKVTVEVPRCARCEKAHSQQNFVGCVAMLVVAVPAIWSATKVWKALDGFWAVGAAFVGIFLAACAVVGFLSWVGRPEPIREGWVRPQDAWREFPPAKELLDQGWAPGDKPAS